MKFAKNDPEAAKKYFADKLAFTMGPVELKSVLGQDELRVIDVRAASDYDKAHIPGSVNLPRDRWASLEGLMQDGLNVVLCYSQVCHLAATAAVEFASKGYSVMELEGGFKAWREHGLPLEGSEVTSEGKQRSAA